MKIYYFILTFLIWNTITSQENKSNIKIDNTLALLTSTSNFDKFNTIVLLTSEIKNFTTEFRYNYEFDGNYTFYIAKNFILNEKYKIKLAPLIGYTFGKQKGYSLDLQLSIEFLGYDIIVDNQYTSTFDNQNKYFFNWLIARYKVSNKLKLGVSTQIVADPNADLIFDKGILVSYLIHKNIRISAYYYNPFQNKGNTILSLRTYF